MRERRCRYSFRVDKHCLMRIRELNRLISTLATSVFNDPNFARHLSELHDKYIVIFPHKTKEHCCMCKSYWLHGKELCIKDQNCTLATLHKMKSWQFQVYVISFWILRLKKKNFCTIYWIYNKCINLHYAVVYCGLCKCQQNRFPNSKKISAIKTGFTVNMQQLATIIYVRI